MGDDLLLAGLAYVEPPLSGECGHAHEHLRVHRREPRRESVRLELVGQEVFDLPGDVDDQAREGSRLLGYGRVPHEDAESVGLRVDVVEERHAGLLEEESRMGPLECTTDHGQQVIHLAIHDDGVETLLATEMLVDDGLRDSCGGGDLLDRHRLEALVGEEGATDLDELLASFAAGHAHG